MERFNDHHNFFSNDSFNISFHSVSAFNRGPYCTLKLLESSNSNLDS